MVDVWNVVHTERESLIEDLSVLPDGQWNTPSLCKGWTVHDVLAHLVDDARTTRFSFIRGLILAGFNFNRLNQNGVNRERRHNPQETLAAFQQEAHRTGSAPAPLASRLVEIIVHGEDIRRPLGIPHAYAVDATIEAIEYQLATSDSMGGSKGRAAGLRLIATDADWSHGSGVEVQGRAIDLLVALTGRSIPTDALSGAGAASLMQTTAG